MYADNAGYHTRTCGVDIGVEGKEGVLKDNRVAETNMSPA